jgi:hypothetical protein
MRCEADIRPAATADFEHICALNLAEIQHTSALGSTAAGVTRPVLLP